jgi:hypothetical protein
MTSLNIIARIYPIHDARNHLLYNIAGIAKVNLPSGNTALYRMTKMHYSSLNISFTDSIFTSMSKLTKLI